MGESSPVNSDKFMRLRDELWWRCRQWLESREVRIPDQNELIGDLTTPTYEMLSTGKIKIEGKADIKKRLPRSPDMADALCLTFAVSDRRFKQAFTYPNLGIV